MSNCQKRAMITGITGQDGSYLAEFLLSKGYEVHGLVRRSSGFNTGRIDHVYSDPHIPSTMLFLHYGDLADGSQLANIIYNIKPDEIYNLAAQSHVRVSFDLPEYTGDVTAIGTHAAVGGVLRQSGIEARFYQASSSEMFGRGAGAAERRSTPFVPRSPYAAAKLYSYWMVGITGKDTGCFACNGILFNHESPRRGETFVTKKITRGLAQDHGRARRHTVHGQPRQQAGLGLCARIRRGHVDDAAAGRGRRLRHRDGRDALGAGVFGGGVLVCRA